MIRGILGLESLIRVNFRLESLIRDNFGRESLIRQKFGSGTQPGYRNAKYDLLRYRVSENRNKNRYHEHQKTWSGQKMAASNASEQAVPMIICGGDKE